MFLDASTDVGAALGGLFGILILIALVGLYFLPSIIAFSRHQQEGMVFVINFFLGWTLVGWVVALAISAGSKSQPMVIQQTFAQPISSPGRPFVSPDGRYWWDGRAWQQMPSYPQTPPTPAVPPPPVAPPQLARPSYVQVPAAPAAPAPPPPPSAPPQLPGQSYTQTPPAPAVPAPPPPPPNPPGPL